MSDATTLALLCTMVSSSIAMATTTFLLYYSTQKSGGGGSAPKTGGTGDLGTALVGTSGATNITFYGQNKQDDNGEGYAGVDLFKLGTAGITFQGKAVYPAAVHQDHFAQFSYKVLALSGPNIKPVYVYVVDACNASEAVCKTNVKKNGKNFLVDVHATGFSAIGKNDGIETGTYKVIGEIRPSQLPLDVWMPKVKAGTDSMICSCTGKCASKSEVKWLPLKSCK